MKLLRNKAAFTLIELIMVIAVFLILAASTFFILNTTSKTGQAKDVKRYQDITAIAQAIELYQIDDGALPGDFLAANVDTDEKYAICTAADELTCDGQTRDCLVVNDADFIDNYLGGSLPFDPDSTITWDTGYYISRSGDKMVIGVCNPYQATAIEYIARATLPVPCGNGIVEGDEVCDDGNIITEGCANGQIDPGGIHCNSTCTTEIIIAVEEACDYNIWSPSCIVSGYSYTRDLTVEQIKYCNQDCTIQVTNASCEGPGGGII